MRIAVVGTGISGLVAAHLLAPQHELVVYEAGDHVGGHTHTHDVTVDGRTWAVDTGFIVFNERTYPNLLALFEKLGVRWKRSDMSFAVKCERTGLEYNGTSTNALFAQRTNLLRPRFWRMIRDILRFYREAPALLEGEDDRLTLGEYLRRERYSDAFVEEHLIPMGAAVWSTSPAGMLEFPARYLVRFFDNHGFLQVDDRPDWLVVEGGSRSYVEPLTAGFADAIRLHTPVTGIRRFADRVEIDSRSAGGESRTESFDRVVIASHGDTALRLLQDPSDQERDVLGCFQTQANETVLHTDASLLPRRSLARAAWNFHVTPEEQQAVTVTYWMNRLQGLEDAPDFLVTLNRTEAIDPDKILRRLSYRHPLYTPAAVEAQGRHAEINGVNRTHFCGAYWRYGFHEDGVVSALAAVEPLGVTP